MLLVLVALLAAGCESDGGTARTPVPTRVPQTVTPRSTALPDVADAPFLGVGERQIVLQIALFGEEESILAQTSANQLQNAFADELDLEVQVEFVDETVALEALCSGAPRAAWISAFSLAKVQQICDVEPVLGLQRGRVPRATVGQSADIISRVAQERLDQLPGLTFCRNVEQDYFTSWVYPRLLLTAAGIDVETDITVVDYPDDMALGRALFRGDCNAAALPPGEFENFLDDLARDLSSDEAEISSSELEDTLHIMEPAGDIEASSGAGTRRFDEKVIPYEVLVFAPTDVIPADLQSDIVEVIEDFFDDAADGADNLNDLLDATGLITVNSASYDDFIDLVADAGWDMTAAD